MRKHYTAAQRAALIDSVTTGQASLRAAASQLGVAESTAYYWLKRTGRNSPAAALATRGGRPREGRQLPAPPIFARLVSAGNRAGAISLRVGEAVIEVRPGFDVELLRSIVAALVEPAL